MTETAGLSEPARAYEAAAPYGPGESVRATEGGVEPGEGEPATLGEEPARLQADRPRSRLDRTPLRLKLMLAIVVLSAIVLALSGIIATTALRGFLLSQLDDRLDSAFAQLESQLRSEQVFSPPGLFVDVLDASGASVVTRRDALPEDIPELPTLDDAAVTARAGKIFTVPSAASGESDWRVAARVVHGGPGRGLGDGPGNGADEADEVTLVVGTSRAEADQTVRQLVGLQAGIGALALIALAVVASVVIRRSLRPLEEIESVAEDIAAGDLARRVPDPDERTEVGRLAAALNGMLARIESAVRDREAAAATASQSEQRMRRFVADASHELRTPLTSIRGFAELYRQGAVPDGKPTGRAMARIESEAGRMNLLVEDMLLLARLDERRPLQRSPVDLLPLAVDAVYDARAVAPDRPIELSAAGVPEPTVLGDEARLRQVLGNLMSNALAHTPPGTLVQVRVGVKSDQVVVEVADRGPGLDAEQAARVFERFYRADLARSRPPGAGSPEATRGGPTVGPAGGSGLGLAIVAAITAAHHGRVEVDSTPGAGATFRVLLPYAPQP